MKKFFYLFFIVLLMINLTACEKENLKEKEPFIINENYITNIKLEEVETEGLKKDYNFLFLTDTHLVIKDENDTVKEQEYEDSLTSFTNKNGIKSEDAFPYWIEYANNIEIDALLMGGDIISYPTEGGVDFLKDNFLNLDVPYIYTIGNHDWTFPDEYFTNYEYLDMLSNLTSHYVLEYDDLIVFTIDTSTDQITKESLDLFKEKYNSGKKIIVLLHVPISTGVVSEQSKIDWGRNIAMGEDGINPNNLTAEFLALINAKESPVICVLGGHLHFYNRSLLSNGTTVQIVGDDGYGGNALLIKIKSIK